MRTQFFLSSTNGNYCIFSKLLATFFRLPRNALNFSPLDWRLIRGLTMARFIKREGSQSIQWHGPRGGEGPGQYRHVATPFPYIYPYWKWDQMILLYTYGIVFRGTLAAQKVAFLEDKFIIFHILLKKSHQLNQLILIKWSKDKNINFRWCGNHVDDQKS